MQKKILYLQLVKLSETLSVARGTLFLREDLKFSNNILMTESKKNKMLSVR